MRSICEAYLGHMSFDHVLDTSLIPSIEVRFDMYKMKNSILICFWIFGNIVAILNLTNFYCGSAAGADDHTRLLNDVLYILSIC